MKGVTSTCFVCVRVFVSLSNLISVTSNNMAAKSLNLLPIRACLNDLKRGAKGQIVNKTNKSSCIA